MKLYDADAGNAKRVRIYLAEKGIELPTQRMVLGTDTRSPAYRRISPLGEVPALQLDDGQVITESNAICRFLEKLYPEPALMGSDAIESAQIDMWSERVYYQLFLTIGLMVRHQLPLFADVIEQVPAFADSLRVAMPEKWRSLERLMTDDRPYIAGQSFSYADVQGMTVITISDHFDLSPPADCPKLNQWADAMRTRPSWNA